MKKRLLEQVHSFLKNENGGVELWIIIFLLLSIITVLFTADIEIKRVKQAKFEIKEQLISSLKGATKRIDFYEASEGNIVIESDYIDQFKMYMQDALLLDESLMPLNVKDFGITGGLVVNKLEIVPSGYDHFSKQHFKDIGLISLVHVPMTMRILGIDFNMDIPFKVYAEIRR